MPTREWLKGWWRDPWHRALVAVIAGSLVLNATGILWGLPGYGWAGDEITPGDIMPGIALRFSHGWWSKWPPLQYYVNALAYSPFLLLNRLRVMELYGLSPFGYTRLLIVGRVVSLAAGAGTLIAVYECGARAFSKRAGLFAAAALALVAPFVYYAKTANTDGPWLFWCVLAFVFYLRVLDSLTRRDLLLFAVTATLAICAKDQSYGLFLIAPAVIVYELWRRNRRDGTPRPLRRAVLDKGLWTAGGVAAALFMACHNLAFNYDGFLKHVHYITGGGSEDYRMFAPGLAGRVQLLKLTASLDQASWGWPLLVLSLAGFVLACSRRETRRPTVSLMVLVVAYYVGFIDVILYNYDRFLLPVCAVQALFVGVAIDRALNLPVWGRWLGTLAVSGAFAYTLLYASTVDVLMLRDSRYTVEDWLGRHVRSDEVVATMFPMVNRPRLDAVHWIDVASIDDLRRNMPAFYIVNVDYARAADPQSQPGQLVRELRDGSLGYSLEVRYRSPNPWPWLPGADRDLVGPRLDTNVSSMLRYINPTMEVFRRADASR